jgi:hypothetical protein
MLLSESKEKLQERKKERKSSVYLPKSYDHMFSFFLADAQVKNPK